MLNSKQLYQNNNFQLPQIGNFVLQPFPIHNVEPKPDIDRNNSLAKIFNNQENQYETNFSAYSTSFQQICAKQNLYPFMLDAGYNRIGIVCRDCILLCEWSANILGKSYLGGDDIMKLQKSQRIRVADAPTAIKVGKYSMLVGFQTGRISQYSYKTHSWQGVCDQLQFPVMQIQIFNEQQNKQTTLIGMDSAGNITLIVFSHKTFMDKIIKTTSTAKWISFVFRNKKRQKIKKIFKNLISKDKQKEANDTQNSSSETVGDSVPYTYNKFHLKCINNDWILSVFRKNCLQILVIDQGYHLRKTIQVDDSRSLQKEVEVAFIQLGEGGFQNSNSTHNIIVLAIDHSLLVFRLIAIEDSYEIVKISQIQTEQKLLYGTFISNNLLCIGDKEGIYLATINDHPHRVMTVDLQKFSYLNFFIQQDFLDMDKKLIYNNLFRLIGQGQRNDKQFICLEGKRLIVGQFLSWQSILQKQIYNNQWQSSIRCFQNIYNGSFRRCCNISQDIAKRNLQMRDFCNRITKGYLIKNLAILLDLSEERRERNYIVNNVVYFLLKCDQSQLLFTQVQQFIAKNQLTEIFMDELSHYIEQINGYNLKIPFITQKILQLIIKKYKQRSQDYILERLFMQFDLTMMQRLVLLTICLKEQLYQSLIYICCQQKDYITPIIKLCGIRLTHPQKQNRIAEVIYWYLSECLLGRMTDYGNQVDYINMLAILINFVFIPSSLQMLLQTSHIYLVQVINMFFQPRILRCVLENQDKFFMRKGEDGDPIFQKSVREYKLYQKMLSILIRVVQNIKDVQKQKYQLSLNRLLTSIMLKNQFPFLISLKIKIILFYIAHPFLFLQQNQTMTQQNQMQINGHLMRLLDSIIRSINQKCLYLRQKIKQDSNSIQQLYYLIGKQKQKQLNNILQSIMLSQYNMQFSQTKCYIHHELGHYAQVLEIYLRMTNKKIRIKIYQYLENNLLEDSQLTHQFMKYMISLLNMDQKKTMKLIWSLKDHRVDHEEVIDKLVQFPIIQLGYIEKVIGSGAEKSKKLLLRHLQIVLREKSQEVESYITRIDYPLEQAFRMCEERNNRMGKACILIKSGRNMEGVVIITQIFLQSIQQYLRGLFKKVQYEPDKKDKIMKQFRVVLDTCSKEWLIDNDRGEEIWEKNTQIIFKKLNINNIDGSHIPQTIRDILNEIVTELLSTMLEQVSTDFFLNRFVKTFSSLPFRIFVQAYKYIFHRLEFTFTLQKLNKDLLQEQQMSLWRNLMSTIYHGHVCNIKCNTCNHSITINERMVSYDCGHIFHEQCYYQQNNKKSKNQLCPLCYNNVDSFMICGQNKLPRYRLQIDEKELHRFKINKMGYYDRTSLKSNLQSWGKFQEWIDL